MTFQRLEQEIIACRKCPRLVEWREQVGMVKRRAFSEEIYWAKPVPGFGDALAKVMVLGLAPGAHGSNRTGRMFTGDASGDFLYPALFRAGFTNQPYAKSIKDGLELKDLYITAVCHCAPPDNKPFPVEISNCQGYQLRELDFLNDLQGIVALGKIAYTSAIQLLRVKGRTELFFEFGHGVFNPGQEGIPWLMGSYHPSRQNTQTGRLTTEMFDQIWTKVNQLIR